MFDGLKYKKEEFEKKCKYYAEKVSSYTEQNKFIKGCRKSILGDGSYRQWTREEIVWRVEILEKYFPNETKVMLEYVEHEKIVRERKKKVREQRDKLLDMREKL